MTDEYDVSVSKLIKQKKTIGNRYISQEKYMTLVYRYNISVKKENNIDLWQQSGITGTPTQL